MKIAMVGGTFDPIHNGHIRAAQVVSDAFSTDEVHFIPAFSPPHKSPAGLTSAFHRFAMVALAITPFDRFRVSPIEADTLKSRYSVETLELMHRRFPAATFLFVAGTDMYQEIDEWKDYRRVLELASFAVVNRRGFPMREDVAPVEILSEASSVPAGDGAKVYFLPFIDEAISSTEIREAAKRRENIEAWVPPAVAAYITKHKLYE